MMPRLHYYENRKTIDKELSTYEREERGKSLL